GGGLGWAARPPRLEAAPRHALVGHLAVHGGQIPDEIVVTLLGDVEVYAAPCGQGEILVAVLGPRGRLRRVGRSVLESYRATVERAHPELIGAPLAGRVWGAGPFRTSPRTVAEGRAFLVGDSAGFLDPLTGDGIAAGLAQAETPGRQLGGPTDLAPPAGGAAAAAAHRASWAAQVRRP